MHVDANAHVVIPINRDNRALIGELTVQEEEVLKKIGNLNKILITGAAAGIGASIGAFFGYAISRITGQETYVTGAGVAVGSVCGGYFAWTNLPKIVKTLLATEYNKNITDLFKGKFYGTLDPLIEEIENSRSFQNGEILYTAFKVKNPKCTLPPHAVFSLQEVQQMLAKPFKETDPLEAKYNFWRGDFVPDYETTERVNRQIIAIVQKIIQDLDPTGNAQNFTNQEITELKKIQERLKIRLLSIHDHLFENLEIVHDFFNKDIIDKKKTYYYDYMYSDSLIITHAYTNSGDKGSLIHLEDEKAKKLNPIQNKKFREKAFKGDYSFAYLNGIFDDVEFTNRTTESKNDIEEKIRLDEIEFLVRKHLINFENGRFKDYHSNNSINEQLNKPLEKQFEIKIKEYISNTQTNIHNGYDGYLKREIK